jgi:hypothetical protein
LPGAWAARVRHFDARRGHFRASVSRQIKHLQVLDELVL